MISRMLGLGPRLRTRSQKDEGAPVLRGARDTGAAPALVLASVVSTGAIMEMESLEATADDAPHEDDDDEPYH